MQAKNIIFDFGGVFYDVDYLRTAEALASLSPVPSSLLSMHIDELLDLPQEFEKGLINSTSFINYLRNQFGIIASDREIIEAWNAMLGGLKANAIEVAAEFAMSYRIILLSNTNEIHYKKFNAECQNLYPKFEDVFFSHQIGMRKPDKEVFDFVCQKMKFSPDETIFVDDNVKNSSGALEKGIEFVHFERTRSLSELLHSIRNITHNNHH